MIAVLLTIYTAIVMVLFKFKLIKPRPYPIAGVMVGGILIVGGIVAAWWLCAPMSPKVVATQYVVQLVPYVKGQVKKIYAKANQPLKKGDLLLEIEPAPFQFTVNQLQAQLQAAKETVKESQAGLESAKANVQKAKDGVAQALASLQQGKAGVANAVAALTQAKAADELAKTEEQIALKVQKTYSGAISELKVTQAVQNRLAADATVSQATAAVAQAQAAENVAEAQLAGSRSAQLQAEAAARQALFTLKVNESNVPGVQAQLADALFNLAQCRMLAPGDGYVVDWTVQEGTMIVAMPFRPTGVFINTSETVIVASFPQNWLMNVEPENDVEMVFDPYPGRLFKGNVDFVIPATGEGEYTNTGNLPSAAKVGSYGVLAVRIRLTNDNYPSLPLGAGGTAAIYTKYGKPVQIISKVAIRMKKWLLYVLPTVEKP
jgi:multidrug resistance efflux pump